jgi:hypothetical protein
MRVALVEVLISERYELLKMVDGIGDDGEDRAFEIASLPALFPRRGKW